MSSKDNVITFKVDDALAEIIKNIPNRSDFIRQAVLNYLDATCPLCLGDGKLSVSQKEHWQELIETYDISRCTDCNGFMVKKDE